MKKSLSLISTIFVLVLASCSINGNKKKLNGIEITSLPNKLIYSLNEEFDYSGLEVAALYSNDTTEIISNSELTFSNFDSSQANENYEITVSYKSFSDSFSVQIVDSTLPYVTGIRIVSQPSKKDYYVNEQLDLTGLVVEAIYSDESYENLNNNELTISGFNSSKEATNQIVTISYLNFRDTFTVNILEKSGPVVTDIEIKHNPNKTTYKVGELLDLTGLVVKASYSDFSEKTIDNSELTIIGFDSSKAIANQVVVVSYEEFTDYFTVNIIEDKPATITGIRIVTYPNKMTYRVGQQLDLTGLLVKADYSDYSSKEIAHSDLQISGFDSSTAINSQKVTISYSGYSAFFNVKIVPATATVTGIAVISEPTKTSYKLGESLILTGLEVVAYYDDDTEETIDNSKLSITGFDSSSANSSQKITVTYQGYSDYFYVEIVDPSDPMIDFEYKDLYTNDGGKTYQQMALPKNYKNPETLVTTLSADSSTWSNNDLSEDLPNNFRFIYGNASDDGMGSTGSKASPSFYSSSSGGGLKFDQISKGFQSQMFTHEGAKLEVRMGISQVNECSDKVVQNKDLIRVYCFNSVGDILGYHAVEPGEIIKSTAGKDVSFYITESYTVNIAYFEVRLLHMAYKSSQCYNIGISHFNFKSWERA